tara:strand:- start:13 stop:576 length:564 start_codon:yes stop_codon:yes gene_type:complete
MVVINEKAPPFEADAYHTGEIVKINSSDLKGKWVVLVFYPADFTFVCPTELGEVADHYSELQKLNVEVLSVSTDTAYVHKAWHDASDTIKKINYPMLADPSGKMCKEYGTYIHAKGMSLRGTFIIDPDGVLKAYELHDNAIGRSAVELVRKIQAAQHVRDSKGEVCPVNWKPGDKTLKPGLELVGKI